MNESKLSALDMVCCIMDSPQRPLDFAVMFHLTKVPDIEALRLGARSARNLYPATGSRVDGKRWVRWTGPVDEIEAFETASRTAVMRAVEEFMSRPFDPQEHLPVRQLLITDNDGKAKLITRFHHAAADGMSAAMWLSHQLRVARRQESPVIETATFQSVSLKSHPSPVRKSRFAYSDPSDRLWTPSSQPLRARSWHTIKIIASDLPERSRRIGGFTYNDLLATCALEVFIRWNRMHVADCGQKIGLWLPINIRKQSFSGFGNGSSRIRLYARYANHISLLDKCREVHRQVFWSIRHGEWAVPPESHPLLRAPLWVGAPLIRCYLNRPWTDMATGVFSHADRWAGRADDETFQDIEKIECIGQLHRRHSVVINGTTHQGQTWLTFTYDPGLLTFDDIHRLAEMYQEQIAQARRELA